MRRPPPPEALLTPDPLLEVQQESVACSGELYRGTDGHVHSAFVLDSGGPDEDQVVLRAVSTCDTVPRCVTECPQIRKRWYDSASARSGILLQ